MWLALSSRYARLEFFLFGALSLGLQGSQWKHRIWVTETALGVSILAHSITRCTVLAPFLRGCGSCGWRCSLCSPGSLWWARLCSPTVQPPRQWARQPGIALALAPLFPSSLVSVRPGVASPCGWHFSGWGPAWGDYALCLPVHFLSLSEVSWGGG